MKIFNPEDTGVANGNYFGMPFSCDEAALVLVSVPWDVTSSYGGGAFDAPESIIAASPQLDFLDPAFGTPWRRGIATLPIDLSIKELSALRRADAVRVIEALEDGEAASAELVDRVNAASEEVNRRIYSAAREWLAQGKIVGLVGGDHSTPYGLVRALGELSGSGSGGASSVSSGLSGGFSVLHIDAHADLRDAYEGFTHSHASIMHNILKDVPAVDRLVQVGVRDQSETEARRALDDPRVTQFTDWSLAAETFRGTTWDALCTRIVSSLGPLVYISFDIDGLSPDLCPGTGTPVPGGLSFNQAAWLVWRTVHSGRRILGFDLCEVAPHEGSDWDANVGARLLFKLCCAALT